MSWFALSLVALGGAVGAVLRYTISMIVGAHVFPWATLSINILGALGIGVVWGAFAHADWFVQWGRLFVVVGVLGGFTTFSAFSLESLSLMQSGRMTLGLVYAGASVIVCLIAVLLGERCGQLVA